MAAAAAGAAGGAAAIDYSRPMRYESGPRAREVKFEKRPPPLDIPSTSYYDPGPSSRALTRTESRENGEGDFYFRNL